VFHWTHLHAMKRIGQTFWHRWHSVESGRLLATGRASVPRAHEFFAGTGEKRDEWAREDTRPPIGGFFMHSGERSS
jgi:hypothetical protein